MALLHNFWKFMLMKGIFLVYRLLHLELFFFGRSTGGRKALKFMQDILQYLKQSRDTEIPLQHNIEKKLLNSSVSSRQPGGLGGSGWSLADVYST
jgi:hypothetical protein